MGWRGRPEGVGSEMGGRVARRAGSAQESPSLAMLAGLLRIEEPEASARSCLPCSEESRAGRPPVRGLCRPGNRSGPGETRVPAGGGASGHGVGQGVVVPRRAAAHPSPGSHQSRPPQICTFAPGIASGCHVHGRPAPTAPQIRAAPRELRPGRRGRRAHQRLNARR